MTESNHGIELVDTHCHLADPRLDGELDAVMERAADAGVRRIVTVGAIGEIEADRRSVEIARRYPHVVAVVGVHPHNASDCSQTRIAQVRELAADDNVVAIGETGLDFHYKHSTVEQQENALRMHLALACELNKPVVIHCRAAEARLAQIVREVGMPPAAGVIHCFTGDSKAAEAFLELGFYVSFSGIATFKNASELRKVVPVVPGERLLVETDAPYLTPEPHRGKRNEPSFVALTLAAVARERGEAIESLAPQVMRNARRLFRMQ